MAKSETAITPIEALNLNAGLEEPRLHQQRMSCSHNLINRKSIQTFKIFPIMTSLPATGATWKRSSHDTMQAISIGAGGQMVCWAQEGNDRRPTHGSQVERSRIIGDQEMNSFEQRR